ncbi:MAG: DUF2231 domain-containing protein [Thermodesulfobacteriota bacterium]
MKEIDLEELEQSNGKDGNPVYVAYQGKVYDVSRSKLWKTGRHMNRHQAGRDLTTDFQAAPHTPEVLERYPQVGVLGKTEVIERRIPAPLARLLKRVPMLKRHPHPMTIHFPIVFTFATLAFNILYLATGLKSFETTALHCLGAGILFTPVAMLTGFYTWWLNYQARFIRPVVIKQVLSLILLPAEAAAFVWRLLDPGILDTFRPGSTIYFLLLVSLFGMVTVIGWFGANLTFPVERDG